MRWRRRRWGLAFLGEGRPRDPAQGVGARDGGRSEDLPQREDPVAPELRHGGPGQRYIGDLVFGGLDGIVTTFAIVSGVAGANLSSQVVLILGFANLFADGVSMATASYFAGRSEREYYERERARERWEVENIPEAEQAELRRIYRSRGYSWPEAHQLVAIQSREPERLVDTMMTQQLNLLPEERRPLRSALATFVAFVIAGALPLSTFVAGLFTPLDPDLAFPIAAALTGVALFLLGAARVLVTERNWLRSGLEMLLVGGLAAAAAYLVGFLLRGLAPNA